MELRGFTGTFHNLHELKMEKNDFLLLAVSLGCGIILLVI
jgi:energy-coupling factor transporter transmembrane protein EcfT